jgi:hypothetical protein
MQFDPGEWSFVREVVNVEANVTPSAFAPIFAVDRNRKHE